MRAMSASYGVDFTAADLKMCKSEISRWQKVVRLVAKFDDLEPHRQLIEAGDFEGLKKAWRENDPMIVDLIKEARRLNVRNYGLLTKKELKIEIERYKRGEVTRRKFEKERKRISSS